MPTTVIAPVGRTKYIHNTSVARVCPLRRAWSSSTRRRRKTTQPDRSISQVCDQSAREAVLQICVPNVLPIVSTKLHEMGSISLAVLKNTTAKIAIKKAASVFCIIIIVLRGNHSSHQSGSLKCLRHSSRQQTVTRELSYREGKNRAPYR
jgi:hypothetical protein